MHYQLFLPDWPQGANDEARNKEARIRGVEDILTGSFDALPGQPGPQDQNGLLVAWVSQANPHHCYKPSQQTWLPSMAKIENGRPAYWIGLWNSGAPTESELRRPYTQNGVWIKLGDEKWKLPTPWTVDAKAVYQDHGSMKWVPVRQFSWMVDEAEKMHAKYLQATELTAMSFHYEEDPTEQIAWLLKLLRINYRLLPELAVHLEMWSGRKHLLEMFLASINLMIKASDDGNEN